MICGIPLDKQLKKILRRVKSTKKFTEYRNRVKLNKTIFYVVSLRHFIGGIKGKLTFCFNEHLKKEIKESRYDEIANAQQHIVDGKAIKPDLEKFFGKNKQLLKYRLNEAEEFDRYSCIFTTAKLSNTQLVRTYFDKDLVEKAFQSLKGVVKLRLIRHWFYNRVVAHVMICYLALVLLSLLKVKLKELDISPVNALRELETMYKVYGQDIKKGLTFSRTVALTKQQEKILRAVDKRLITQV